jgi:hypothetical protein
MKRGLNAREETAMRAIGAIFEPELIELMKSALDGAATMLPPAKRTPGAKLRLASRIIAAAAKGECDPVQLRIAALLEIVDDHVELERSYFELKHLREKVEQAEAAAQAQLERAPFNAPYPLGDGAQRQPAH